MLQCYHCGREVFETTHTQKSYRVDFYLLHTGHTEWEYLVNAKEHAPPFRYRKLTQPIDILSCVECYARPDIRLLLDDDFTGRHELTHVRPKADHEQSVIQKVDE
jgi:hypothetical protein